MKKVKYAVISIFILCLLSNCVIACDNNKKEVNKITKIDAKQDITAQLSNTEIKNLNSFLSNFSRCYLNEFNSKNINSEELGNFAFTYNKINYNNRINVEQYEGNSYFTIDESYIDNTIKELFGVNIEHKDGKYHLYKNNKYMIIAAEGDQHNDISQVDRFWDNKDGTFTAEVSIYRPESIDIDDRYYTSKSTWSKDMECQLIGTAKAVMKPIKINEKETYQIIEYKAEDLTQQATTEIKEQSNKDKENDNGYTRDKVNSILKSLNKGSLNESEGQDKDICDKVINGELCYVGSIVYGTGNRVRFFWVGSKSLTMYNYDGEAKGSIYDTQNFDTEF